jgi:amino-acid N-acetyltransferase
MSDTVRVRVRPAIAADREWILPLASRLHDFGPPPYRGREAMDRAVAASIHAALLGGSPGAEVLVAEGEEREPLGFVHLHAARDFFTGEEHGHVRDIVVAAGAEGRGVGRALMAAAEGWAQRRAYRLLSLHVFEENVRARRFYERLGYHADIRKLIKPIEPALAPCEQSDLPVVVGLLQAAGLPHSDITPAMLAHFLLASRDGSAIGVVGLEPYGPVGLLRSLAVAPSGRGVGLGAGLTRAIERHARACGVRTVYLLTTTAERFFARLGYRAVPREEVPPAIQATTEYRELCASTSACMARTLD